MPLYKRSYFNLVKQPEGLDPRELVFQVRFTKEIFRDYQDYLNRLNFYRQRVWTCKATGKTNLTYEEALVSERRASEKVQQIPKELAAPILREVQYSTLKLKDLVDSVSAKLLERLFKGAELYAQRGDSVCACRVLDIFEEKDKARYKVGWFDKDKEITNTSIINSQDLIRKKLPFSRITLKSFIREVTCRSCPWVIYEDVAKKHDISSEPPEELREKLSVYKGQRWTVVNQRSGLKRRKGENVHGERSSHLQKKAKTGEEHSRYPIDDLLVKLGPEDPVFCERPTPCREFGVPMDCVGDLLMVWDFCSSFCRLLRLFPFSLEDFEKSICHKDGDLVLIAEAHASMLRSIIQDEGEFFEAVQSKKRKTKITQSNWSEFLCELLEMLDAPELSAHLGTIKRGHYGLLDPPVKLAVFRQLVEESLATDSVRDQLDEYVEQQRELVAAKREEQRRKRAEEPEAAAVAVVNGKGKQGQIQNGLSINGMENGSREVSSSGSSTKLKRIKKEREREVDEKNVGEQQHIDGEMEKRFIRTNALGKDRNHNRYWFFRRDGRLFVESADFKQWGFYASKQELDALIGSLNPKGERERALKRQLEKYYGRISCALQKRSKDMAQKILLEEAVLRRSTRVRAQPRDSPSMAFLRYANKWRED